MGKVVKVINAPRPSPKAINYKRVRVLQFVVVLVSEPRFIHDH